MESLRVPGTMVMDSNAGSRAPTMSRFEFLSWSIFWSLLPTIKPLVTRLLLQTEPIGVTQHVMQCSNPKINSQGTAKIQVAVHISGGMCEVRFISLIMDECKFSENLLNCPFSQANPVCLPTGRQRGACQYQPIHPSPTSNQAQVDSSPTTCQNTPIQVCN